MAIRSKKSSSNVVVADKKMKMKKLKDQLKHQSEEPASQNANHQFQQHRNNKTNDVIANLVIDSSVTVDTLKSLSAVLFNDCTKKIFFEFTEREFSSNHVSFFFEAKAYRDSFVLPTSASSTPEPQQPESMDVSSSRRSSVNVGNDMPSSSASPSDQQLQLPMSVAVATRSGSISSDGANKVSRESSTLDLEMTADMIEQKNLENASKLFDKYLSPSSPIEINIDFRTFSDINKRIQNGQITEKLYDRAIKEIFDIINNDSFHRFKQSPIFYAIQKHCIDNNQSSSSSTSPDLLSLTPSAQSPNLSSAEPPMKKQRDAKRKSLFCFS